MHETVLASSLLSILQETMAKYRHKGQDTLPAQHTRNASPIQGTLHTQQAQGSCNLHIEEVVVTVGLLACVEPQTLRGCFEIMAEGTVAHKALLTIVTRPMKGRCPACGQMVETEERRFSCPLCQGVQVDWQDGRGMEITSIRVVDNAVEESA